jgi:putative ABC transport system substrate-binding protein
MTLLGGVVMAWPCSVRAEQRRGVRQIGFLGPQRRLKQLRLGLAELAYIEGRNFVIEHRPSDPADRLPGFAAELVKLKVDVIVASGSLAVRAAQQATRSIPIVMTGASDPVGTGFVASLARPGGNITGMSLQSPALSGKRLEWLKEIVKDLSRLAVLLNPDDPPAVFSLKETERAAQASGLELYVVEVRKADDFDGAFGSLGARRPDALVVLPASIMTEYAGRIAGLALTNKLPTISYFREFPESGGLMSYGPNLDDSARQAAIFVDQILKGAKPSDLAVQQPSKFELVINASTAKQLGLTITPMMLMIAEVIE